MRRYLPEILTGLLIIAASLAVYWQVVDFRLVLRDDIAHYTHFISQAGSWEGLKTITRTPALFPYWVPVTFLSHFIDAVLFKDALGLHHLTNVFFHMASVVLLFAVLRIMTGGLWTSAFAAALFALHPLNVASVVWLGNRSAMVSTFISLLLIGSYLKFLKHKDVIRYLMIILLFVLGLLSRPTMLWFPAMLLLLDFWPLQRLRVGQPVKSEIPGGTTFSVGTRRETNATVLIEKIPLFVLGGLWIIFSHYFFKSTPLSDTQIAQAPNPLAFLNAFVTLMAYLWKCFFPVGLPVHYPQVFSLQLQPAWLIAVAFLSFCGVTMFVAGKGRKHPYLITGWAWYIIGLFPYLPICIGQQAVIIERYAYVPLIGVFIIIAWGGGHLAARFNLNKEIVGVVAIMALVILSITSWRQAKHWTDSVSFFKHAVNQRPDCKLTRLSYGEVLLNTGNEREAISQFIIALHMDASDAVLHNQLGVAYARTGDLESALRHYRKSIDIKPDYVEALNNLANQLADIGKTDEAIAYYQKSLSIDPLLFKVHNNLATALVIKGENDKALLHFKRALAINPEYETARKNLNLLLSMMASRQ